MNIDGVRPLPLYSVVLEHLSDTLPYLFLMVGPNYFKTIQNHLEQKKIRYYWHSEGQERTGYQDFIQLCSEIDMTPTASETNTLKFCSRL